MGFVRVILGAIREFSSFSIILAFQSFSVSSKLDEFVWPFGTFFGFYLKRTFYVKIRHSLQKLWPLMNKRPELDLRLTKVL